MTLYRLTDAKDSLSIGKLICLARTYPKHANEMQARPPKDPLIFLKPESAVIFNQGTIQIPPSSKQIHHEVELGVIIGKQGKEIKVDTALDYVFGYCVCLDITARDIQSIAKKNGWPWSIAKGFDTFAPISNVVLKKEVSDPNNLDLELKVNDQIKQKDSTASMVFSIEEIISHISKIMTLKPGDLIMTGTPEGVGEIYKGDILKARLNNLCHLQVQVQ